MEVEVKVTWLGERKDTRPQLRTRILNPDIVRSSQRLSLKMTLGVLREIKRHLRYFVTITLGFLHYHYTKRFTTRKPKEKLLPVDDITRISGRVTHILGQNPGPFTLQGTNTYLVGSGKEKILIDASEPDKPRYIQRLAEALGEDEIVAIVCSHRHRDHMGGIEDVKILQQNLNIPVYKLRDTKTNYDSALEEYILVDDGYELRVEGATLKFIATRGHTTDHAAFLLEEENILFSGDCILGEGTTIFESLSEYMISLQRLKDMHPSTICPGHGPMITKTEEKIDQYIEHRVKRNNQIIDVLKQLGRANALEITAALYSKLPKSVQIGAFENIRQTLEYLVEKGHVTRLGLIDFKLV